MMNMTWALPLTLGIYLVFLYFKKYIKFTLFNPLLLTTIVLIVILLKYNFSYEAYEEGTTFITYLIGPATVCLALPLYEKLNVLKKHWKVLTLSIISALFIHAFVILLITVLLKSSPEMVATFIPKSVTTAIAKDISSGLGGNVNLTVVIVVLTGVLGAVIGPIIFKIFKINHPVAIGVSFGTASHAVGTAKALEYGDLEASISTLALIITGILTVIISPFLYELIVFIIN